MEVTRERQVRFGRLIKQRRDELDSMTQEQVHDEGGPSVPTLGRIERPGPRTAPPQPTTLKRLEKSLRLVPGSAARTFNGGDLERLEDVDDGGAESDPLSFRVVQIDLTVVQSLFTAADRCSQLFERPDLPQAAVAAAKDAKQELDDAIAQLSAAYATEVLERAGGPGRELPLQIGLTYHQFLNRPPHAGGADGEDQKYRRWLAGLADGLDQDLVDTFTNRWRSKLQQIRWGERGRHQ